MINQIRQGKHALKLAPYPMLVNRRLDKRDPLRSQGLIDGIHVFHIRAQHHPATSALLNPRYGFVWFMF